jgi:hypothetical protein
MLNTDAIIKNMINQQPFNADAQLFPRVNGFSTALSSRYEAWAGLCDEHGQHTIILLTYD